MKSFKVITVCGAGVGTSTLLRMNIELKLLKICFTIRGNS